MQVLHTCLRKAALMPQTCQFFCQELFLPAQTNRCGHEHEHLYHKAQAVCFGWRGNTPAHGPRCSPQRGGAPRRPTAATPAPPCPSLPGTPASPPSPQPRPWRPPGRLAVGAPCANAPSRPAKQVPEVTRNQVPQPSLRVSINTAMLSVTYDYGTRPTSQRKARAIGTSARRPAGLGTNPRVYFPVGTEPA